MDYGCPDCQITRQLPSGSTSTTYRACGLTPPEHKRYIKAWRRAKKQAARQAHQIMLDERYQRLEPEALIQAVYDEANRQVRRGR